MREALDNSQSLLAMVQHLGCAFQSPGITSKDWGNENLTKLLAEQITENREALSGAPNEPQPSAGNVDAGELLKLADRLHAQELGSRADAVKVLRRLAALSEPPPSAATGVPVAWIAFADNGNVRFWTSEPQRAEAEKQRGLDLRAFTLAELIALVSRIPAVPQTLSKPEGQSK
jgi:hypothetical protein